MTYIEHLVVIYTRVSTDEQVKNFSLGFQKDECVRFADKNKWKVVKVFKEEGASAKTVNGRPKLLELIKYCQDKKNHISKVIVYKYDRWARNTEQGLGIMSILAKHGIEVVSATEPAEKNAMGRAMMKIMLVLAELDNDIKSERTTDGMRAAFEKGYWEWKLPIAYTRKVVGNQKKVVLIKGFKEILSKLFEEAATGFYKRGELAKNMNRLGFKKVYGQAATAKTVDKILRKKFYFGIMEAKKWNLERRGNHEAVIDEDTWLRANQALYGKRNYPQRQNANENFPLRRFVLCRSCLKPMTGSFSRGNGGRYPYYHCAHVSCAEPSREARDTLDGAFIEYLNTFKLSWVQKKLLRAVIIEKLEKEMRSYQKAAEQVQAQLDELESEMRALVKAEDRGRISEEELDKSLDDIRSQEAVLKVELSENKIDEFDTENVINFATNFLANPGMLWKNLDFARKRKFQSMVFPQGVWYEDGKFGTNKISPSFELIEAVKKQKSRLVTLPGFEPGFAG